MFHSRNSNPSFLAKGFITGIPQRKKKIDKSNRDQVRWKQIRLGPAKSSHAMNLMTDNSWTSEWHFEFKFVSESVSPGGGWFWIAIGSRKVDPKGWGADLGSCRGHVMPGCALGTSLNWGMYDVMFLRLGMSSWHECIITILGISGCTQQGSIRGPGSHIESHDSMMMNSLKYQRMVGFKLTRIFLQCGVCVLWKF